jgi:hypothetical protein
MNSAIEQHALAHVRKDRTEAACPRGDPLVRRRRPMEE